MAIPSGSGTEVLKVAYGNNVDDTAFSLTCPQNHIYIILSIFVQNRMSSTVNLQIDNVHPATGSPVTYSFVNTQPLTAKQTFIWNDRFVLSGTTSEGSKVQIYTAADGDNVDVTVTYIDQDWT